MTAVSCSAASRRITSLKTESAVAAIRRTDWSRFLAANAHDDVGGVSWQSPQLPVHIADDGTIDSKERCRPAGRQHVTQLGDDVGTSTDVSAVVKDRISEENHVRHIEKMLMARRTTNCSGRRVVSRLFRQA
jgi:hypothetical protein